MAVRLLDSEIAVVPLAFTLEDIEEKLKVGWASNPRTGSLERAGAKLAEANFPADLTQTFVRDVCSWGDYAGVAGRVLKNNSSNVIAATFRAAAKLTNIDDVQGAIEKVCELKGLGVSFASKHLKFIDPTKHVILDSIISGRLGYARTPEGYRDFNADCRDVLSHVRKSGMKRSDGSDYRIADIEMAIFHMLRP